MELNSAGPAVCPQCSGPHSLSQCPNWRGRRILAAGRGDSTSMEAQFHKLLRTLIPKRQQGHVMGAFRKVFTETEAQP